jgi:hypothetical protein
MLLDVGSLNRPRLRSSADKGDLARMMGQVSKFQGCKVSKWFVFETFKLSKL